MKFHSIKNVSLLWLFLFNTRPDSFNSIINWLGRTSPVDVFILINCDKFCNVFIVGVILWLGTIFACFEHIRDLIFNPLILPTKANTLLLRYMAVKTMLAPSHSTAQCAKYLQAESLCRCNLYMVGVCFEALKPSCGGSRKSSKWERDCYLWREYWNRVVT